MGGGCRREKGGRREEGVEGMRGKREEGVRMEEWVEGRRGRRWREIERRRG